jgi:hypothetical protein
MSLSTTAALVNKRGLAIHSFPVGSKKSQLLRRKCHTNKMQLGCRAFAAADITPTSSVRTAEILMLPNAMAAVPMEPLNC